MEYKGVTAENASAYLESESSKVLAFAASLEPATLDKYGELLSRRSKVHAEIRDFSHGKGDDAVKVGINLDLEQFEQLLLFFQSGRAWISGYEFVFNKLYSSNPPDEAGLYPAFHSVFKREAGGLLPWTIIMSNGRAAPEQGRGHREQPGSFVEAKKAEVHLTDTVLYGLLKKVDDYISNYRRIVADKLIPEGLENQKNWNIEDRGKKGIPEDMGRPDSTAEPKLTEPTAKASPGPQPDPAKEGGKKTSGTMDIVILKGFVTIDGYMVSTFACKGKELCIMVPAALYPDIEGALSESLATGKSVRVKIHLDEKKRLICTGLG